MEDASEGGDNKIAIDFNQFENADGAA